MKICEVIPTFNYPLGGKAHIYIGGRDLSEFQAKLETDYAISGCALENAYNQGALRSGFLLLRQAPGLLSITLPINIYGADKQETMDHLADLDAACAGVVELDLSDGFFYTCMLEEVGGTTWLSDEWCTADYRFLGIRHKDPVTVSSPAPVHLLNPGTWPQNDCTITVKNFKAKTSVPVVITLTNGEKTVLTWKIDTSGGLYQAGGDLVLDGVRKRNQYNGGNIPTGTMTWTDYPYLSPGKNTVGISGGLTQAEIVVDYTPAYL